MTDSPEQFVPQGRREEAAPPVYLIRRGNMLDRASIEAELAGECRAGLVSPIDMALAFASGVEKFLAEEAGAAAVMKLRRREERGQQLTPDELGTLAGVRQVLAEHWPCYRRLVLQMARRRLALPTVAFARLCVGWTGLPVEYRRWPSGRVNPFALKGVPPADMAAAGLRAYAMLPAGG